MGRGLREAGNWERRGRFRETPCRTHQIDKLLPNHFVNQIKAKRKEGKWYFLGCLWELNDYVQAPHRWWKCNSLISRILYYSWEGLLLQAWSRVFLCQGKGEKALWICTSGGNTHLICLDWTHSLHCPDRTKLADSPVGGLVLEADIGGFCHSKWLFT